MIRLSSLALRRPVWSRHRSTISCRAMATTAFFFSARLVPRKTSCHFCTALYWLKEDEAPGRLHSDASNGRYSHFSDRAQPLLSSGTPFAGHQARQATDLAPRAITVPIQHFGFQLHQTEGSQSFGPWPLTTPGQADLDLLDLFIQGPQQLHPVLEHLCHPGIHLLTQVAKSLGPPPILQAPIALAQQ